jgi:hypothetical protein
MSKQREIEFICKPDGTVSVEALNAEGPSCELMTRAFQQGLGETISDRKKVEFHQREAKVQHRQTQNQ